jgi:putative spermidine/putrescine transport system permease protein
MADLAQTSARTLPAPPARRFAFNWAWLGVAPFFIFALLFLILPTIDLMVGAFRTPDGSFTLDNIVRLNQPTIRSAYWISIKVSFASAVLGAAAGFFLAWAVVMGRVPGLLRPILTTFSGVASNFAGIPLAFAFLATLGPTGLVTKEFLLDGFGVNTRALGFNILSFWGLTITTFTSRSRSWC